MWPTQLAFRTLLGLGASHESSQKSILSPRGDMSIGNLMGADANDTAAPILLPHDEPRAAAPAHKSTSTRPTTTAETSFKLDINMTAIKDQSTWPPFFSAKSPLNYCGDSTEHPDPEAATTGPLAADCAALKGIVDYLPGYWDVTANAGGDGYMLVTSHLTCGFVVKPWNTAADLLIGSQDVSDLLYDQITQFPGNQTSSTMTCLPGQAITSWAIINLEAE